MAGKTTLLILFRYGFKIVEQNGGSASDFLLDWPKMAATRQTTVAQDSTRTTTLTTGQHATEVEQRKRQRRTTRQQLQLTWIVGRPAKDQEGGARLRIGPVRPWRTQKSLGRDPHMHPEERPPVGPSAIRSGTRRGCFHGCTPAVGTATPRSPSMERGRAPWIRRRMDEGSEQGQVTMKGRSCMTLCLGGSTKEEEEEEKEEEEEEDLISITATMTLNE